MTAHILHLTNDNEKHQSLRFLLRRGHVQLLKVRLEQQCLDILSSEFNTFSGIICDLDSIPDTTQSENGWHTITELLIRHCPAEIPILDYSVQTQIPEYTELYDAGFFVSFVPFNQIGQEFVPEEMWLKRVDNYRKILTNRRAAKVPLDDQWSITLRHNSTLFLSRLEEIVDEKIPWRRNRMTLSDLVQHELQPGDVGVLLNTGSSGATGFLLQCLRQAASVRTIWFHSPKIQQRYVTLRLVAAETGIDRTRLSEGQIFDREWPILYNALDKLSELPAQLVCGEEFNGLKLKKLLAKTPEAERGSVLLILDDYLDLPSITPLDYPFLAQSLQSVATLAQEHAISVIVGIRVQSPTSCVDAFSQLQNEESILPPNGIAMMLSTDDTYLELLVRSPQNGWKVNIPLAHMPTLGIVESELY